MDDLKITPLYEEHKKLNAKFSPFGGWNMPISYESILKEHEWCRRKAAVFDISHMGEFEFRGDIARSGFERALTQNIGTIPAGKSRYGFMLNEAGGVIDDLIVFRKAAGELMVVVNAATAKNDFKVLSSRITGGRLTDISAQTAKIDVQGPLSRSVVSDVFGVELKLKYFNFGTYEVAGEQILISRTGYTGELGYEIFLSPESSKKFWRKLIADDRVKPAGLGARDILRLEAGYSLYGHELDEETTPVEAGLEIFVDYGKDFTGREALLAQKKEGAKKTKIAFVASTRRAPRAHYRILKNGKDEGEVTSGSFSPQLGRSIGIGYIRPPAPGPGEVIRIATDGRVLFEALAAELPFYKSPSLRS